MSWKGLLHFRRDARDDAALQMQLDHVGLKELSKVGVVDINEPGISVKSVSFPVQDDPKEYFNKALDTENVITGPGGVENLEADVAGKDVGLSPAGVRTPLSASIVEFGFGQTIARSYMSNGMAYVISPKHIRSHRADFRFVGDDTKALGEKGRLVNSLGGLPYKVKGGRMPGDEMDSSIDELRGYKPIPMKAVIGIVAHDKNASWMPSAMAERKQQGKSFYPVYAENGDLLWHPSHEKMDASRVRQAATIHYRKRILH
ncbi:hypothetical protein ACFLRF_05205 [Candidatus Altiarchaeota archaeon]